MRFLLFLLLMTASITSSCDSPTFTGVESDHNRYLLSHLTPGLSEDQVINIMGYPHMTDVVVISAADVFNVWYYVTTKKELGQQGLAPRNFTPLFFKDGILVGWGYHFYRHLEGKEAYDVEKEYLGQKKENILHESTDAEHRIVPPPPPPQRPAYLVPRASAAPPGNVPQNVPPPPNAPLPGPPVPQPNTPTPSFAPLTPESQPTPAAPATPSRPAKPAPTPRHPTNSPFGKSNPAPTGSMKPNSPNEPATVPWW